MRTRPLATAFMLFALAGAVGCFCLGFDPEFLTQENERVDKAVAAGDADDLADVCYDPELGGACNGYVRLPAPGVQEKACRELPLTVVRAHEARLAKAIETRDRFELQRLCNNTEIYKNVANEALGLGPVSARACEAAIAIGVTQFNEVAAESEKLGGAPCLARLASAWTTFEGQNIWATATQTTEAQRAAFVTPAEPCLASLEKLAEDGEVFLLYTAFQRTRLSAGPYLSDAQSERLTTLLESMPRRAVLTLEKAAAGWPTPMQALALASASSIAKTHGDGATATRLGEAAHAAIARDSVRERLTLSLSGDGPAALQLVSAIGANLGPSFVRADDGEVVLTVTLTEPELSADEHEVQLSASVREQSGTKRNPAYEKKQEECERDERTVVSKAQSCANSPDLVNCRWYKEAVEKCAKELSKMSDSVPAYKDVRVAYAGTQYEGSARGTLTIRRAGGTTSTYTLVASDTRTANDAAPRANVSAVRADRFGRGELLGMYSARARAAVDEYLAEVANARFQTFLKDVDRAKTKEQLATALVRYVHVAKRMPPTSVTKSVDDALGIPTVIGLEFLSASR